MNGCAAYVVTTKTPQATAELRKGITQAASQPGGKGRLTYALYPTVNNQSTLVLGCKAQKTMEQFSRATSGNLALHDAMENALLQDYYTKATRLNLEM